MFYCCISSNTTTPPTPSGPQSLLSSWEAEEERRRGCRLSIELAKLSFITFCLLVAITMGGIRCKNTANWLEDIWLSFLLTVVLIFFVFPAVHTSATRSGVKTRRGYRWLGRRASSGGWQMKVLRNRDNRHTLQGKARVNWTGWLVMFYLYWPSCLYIDRWLLIFSCIIDSHYPCYRQARGFSLLEQKSTHWKSGICPYNSTTSPLLIERLDLGSTYYKNFFYGKGESTSANLHL